MDKQKNLNQILSTIKIRDLIPYSLNLLESQKVGKYEEQIFQHVNFILQYFKSSGESWKLLFLSEGRIECVLYQ